MMDFTHVRVYQILSSILRPLTSESIADNNVNVEEEQETGEQQ